MLELRAVCDGDRAADEHALDFRDSQGCCSVSSNYRNRSSKKPKPSKQRPVPSPEPKPQTPSERMQGYDRERRHPSGREWKRIVQNVVSYYGGICHLCGHPGALQADHIEQYAEGGNDSLANLRPAHGSANTQKNPCPVCKLNCNNIRGALSVEAGRAKIARRQGIAPEVNEDPGRDW